MVSSPTICKDVNCFGNWIDEGMPVLGVDCCVCPETKGLLKAKIIMGKTCFDEGPPGGPCIRTRALL